MLTPYNTHTVTYKDVVELVEELWDKKPTEFKTNEKVDARIDEVLFINDQETKKWKQDLKKLNK